MKLSNHLDYTAYLTMWKVILLQKFLSGINPSEISLLGRTKKFDEIQNVISKYFGYDVSEDSFNPVTVIDNCSKQTEVSNYLSEQFTAGESTKPLKIEMQDSEKFKQSSNSIVQKQADSYVYVDTWMRAISEFQKAIKAIAFKYNHSRIK